MFVKPCPLSHNLSSHSSSLSWSFIFRIVLLLPSEGMIGDHTLLQGSCSQRQLPFIYLFFLFQPHLKPMEVPRSGTDSKLQLQPTPQLH